MVDWGVGMSVGCTAFPLLFVGADNGWPHNAMRYH